MNEYITVNYGFSKDIKISSLYSLDEIKNNCESIISEDFGLDGKVIEVSDINITISISTKDDADTIGQCICEIRDYLKSIVSDVTISNYIVNTMK